MDRKLKNRIIFIISIILFGAAWEILARLIDSPVVLPSFSETVLRLFKLCATKEFWISFAASFGRVLAAFFVTVITGLILGFASGLSESVRTFFMFPLSLIRSTPVMALIMVVLFWFPSHSLPVICAVLMGLPVMNDIVSKAVRNTDSELLEMANVFNFSFKTKISSVYIPEALPFIKSACRTVFAQSWKVVAAGEILALPKHAAGTLLQDNRMILEPSSVFALTLTLTLFCVLSEKIIFSGTDILCKKISSVRSSKRKTFVAKFQTNPQRDAWEGSKTTGGKILITDLTFAYHDTASETSCEIFNNFNLEIKGGSITSISAPTGKGKTTLLKILSGIIPSSEYEGSITCPKTSVIFQDSRIIPGLSVLKNTALPLFSNMIKNDAYAKAYEFLCKVGLEDKAFAKAEELSGGEKQKLQAARAFAFDAPLILMDEGTNSLDEVSKNELWETMKKLLEENPRTLIFVTHDKTEAQKHASEIIEL